MWGPCLHTQVHIDIYISIIMLILYRICMLTVLAYVLVTARSGFLGCLGYQLKNLLFIANRRFRTHRRVANATKGRKVKELGLYLLYR